MVGCFVVVVFGPLFHVVTFAVFVPLPYFILPRVCRVLRFFVFSFPFLSLCFFVAVVFCIFLIRLPLLPHSCHFRVVVFVPILVFLFSRHEWSSLLPPIPCVCFSSSVSYASCSFHLSYSSSSVSLFGFLLIVPFLVRPFHLRCLLFVRILLARVVLVILSSRCFVRILLLLLPLLFILLLRIILLRLLLRLRVLPVVSSSSSSSSLSSSYSSYSSSSSSLLVLNLFVLFPVIVVFLRLRSLFRLHRYDQIRFLPLLCLFRRILHVRDVTPPTTRITITIFIIICIFVSFSVFVVLVVFFPIVFVVFFVRLFGRVFSSFCVVVVVFLFFFVFVSRLRTDLRRVWHLHLRDILNSVPPSSWSCMLSVFSDVLFFIVVCPFCMLFVLFC